LGIINELMQQARVGEYAHRVEGVWIGPTNTTPDGGVIFWPVPTEWSGVYVSSWWAEALGSGGPVGELVSAGL
jgi:hypothetical protein